MSQLFLKSNLLHIRTNEGEFKVSNPEVLTCLHIRHMPDGDWRIKTPGSGWTGEDVKWPVEWPGGVEFETIAPHPECYKARECLQLTNGLNCSQAYNARTRSTSLCAKAYKLARLIPEEKKDDQPMSFTESAYKEFEGKDLDIFTPSPEQQQRAQFVDWIVLDKLAPDQLFTKVWNTHVVPLKSEIKALRDWKESALAVFAEWDRVSDYIEPRCRLGDKYSARALELFKMIDAENKSLHEEIFTLKNEIDRLKAEVLKEKFPEN